MAETAAILNPDKKILMPDNTATCPLADMLSKDDITKAKRENPGAPLVLYINTNADAKAEADIICTSANAVKVVNSLPQDTVIFGPDKNLAYFVSKRSKKKIIPVPADGYCPAHRSEITKERVISLKKEHQNAIIMSHPECNPGVQEISDYVAGTSGMVKIAGSIPDREFIVATEEGHCYRLKKEFPEKEFYPIKEAVCIDMKKHTLEKVRDALKRRAPTITVKKEIANKARLAIERMLEVK
jgi:quinolinate synthase